MSYTDVEKGMASISDVLERAINNQPVPLETEVLPHTEP